MLLVGISNVKFCHIIELPRRYFLECTCNGRSVYALREHISGRVEEEQGKAGFYLYYDTDGAGKWVVSESINQGQPLLVKASAQSCPHTDDGVPWKYRSTKGRVENDDPSLDLGCGKRKKNAKFE